MKALSHSISNEFVLWDLHFDDIVVVGNELRFLNWSMAPSNDTGSWQALLPAYRHGGLLQTVQHGKLAELSMHKKHGSTEASAQAESLTPLPPFCASSRTKQ